MQQHTGQHILSQSFLEVLRGETRSFHLGPDVSTLEIGIRQASDDELEAVERAANRVVFEDREVRTSFVPEERIHEVPLRRPPKVSGLIRIVEVAGFDWSACGGTHVRRTGEIGLIKVIGAERIRDNARFTFVCGGRALGDYAQKTRLLRRISGQFSAREQDAPAAVEKARAELKDLKRRVKRLAETAAAAEAQELVRGAAGPVISLLLTDRGPEEARALAVHVTRLGGAVALCAAAAGGRGHLFAASSGASGFDVRTLIPVVSAVAPAKGGGGPTLMELVLDKPDGLAAALEAAKGFSLTRIAGR
jgi:alanyl-tRNA synthetase